jgi:hypothetical protein
VRRFYRLRNCYDLPLVPLIVLYRQTDLRGCLSDDFGLGTVRRKQPTYREDGPTPQPTWVDLVISG